MKKLKEFLVVLNNGIVCYEFAHNKQEIINKYKDNDYMYKIYVIRELSI